MAITRRIQENRSTLVLVILVTLSIVSLASGTQATAMGSAVRSGISLAAYPFLQVLNRMEGAADYVSGLLFQYHAAQMEATALRRDVNRLVERTSTLQEAQLQNARLREILDFQRNNPRLTLQPAKIIARNKGILTIDLGSRHGIERNLPVMTPDGFIGVITNVHYFSSDVATVLDPACNVGVIIKRTREHGIVTGSGSDISQYCMLKYVSDVQVNDQLITSAGSRFPSGYPVGTVHQVEGRNGLLRTALVRPAADPRRAEEVAVVRSSVPPLEELSGGRAGEVATLPETGPDEGQADADGSHTPTLQETLAP